MEDIITQEDSQAQRERDEEILKERQEVIRLRSIFERKLLLNDSDKYLLSDYPITAENLEIVKAYRQALRDFTTNNYILPEKPEFLK
jgi:hypothetical protein